MARLTKEQVVRRAAERVYPVFVSEEWEWAGRGVPTVAAIEQTYHELITMAEKWESASTGRLSAQVTDLGIELSLEVGALFGDESEDA